MLFFSIIPIFILRAGGYQGDCLPTSFLSLLALLTLLLLLLTDRFAWHAAAACCSQLLAVFSTITPGFLEHNVLIPSIDTHVGQISGQIQSRCIFYFIYLFIYLKGTATADCKRNGLFQKEQQATMMILKSQLATW